MSKFSEDKWKVDDAVLNRILTEGEISIQQQLL